MLAEPQLAAVYNHGTCQDSFRRAIIYFLLQKVHQTERGLSIDGGQGMVKIFRLIN